MKKILSVRHAGGFMLFALIGMSLFHVAVLAGIAPADMVWGGRAATSAARLQTMESIALVATIGLAWIVCLRLQDIKSGKPRKGITISIWLIFGYLLLNTVGNLASTTSLETWLFTPLTLFLAACALRLAVEKPGAE